VRTTHFYIVVPAEEWEDETPLGRESWAADYPNPRTSLDGTLKILGDHAWTFADLVTLDAAGFSPLNHKEAMTLTAGAAWTTLPES